MPANHDPQNDFPQPSSGTRPPSRSGPPSTITDQHAPIKDAIGSDEDGRLVEILDRYLAELRAGTAPSHEELIAQHADLAGQLEACLAGLEFIHRSESRDSAHPAQLGDFRLLREIGRGGMGVVYEAEQLSLHRRVAVKVLRFGAVSDPEAVDRFRREAETVAKLHHTNIVPIFFVGIENGVNYYAMDFIEGRSLADVLRESNGPIDAMTVVEWGCQAADALAHAHQRGVIHRDVKPSNLLLDHEARIWLTDFGLAKRLDDVTLSLTGALLGTPRYMSPEQASSARHRLDHRTDIYSLGATLYELITGEPVFAAESPHEVIHQILSREPTPPRRLNPSLSRDIETVLVKCLDKNPDQRYDSALALADDLRAVREGRPIRARRASLVERSAKWANRHRRQLTLTAGSVAATVLILLTALFAFRWYEFRQQVYVTLATDQPPLAAEIRDPSGHLLISQTVPTQEPVTIPAGVYQLQVSGSGRLSETHTMHLQRGDSPRFNLHLDESLLTQPLRLDRSYRIVTTKDGSDVVVLDDEGIRCFDMRSSTLRWTASLRDAQHPLLSDQSGWIWPWNRLSRGRLYSGFGAFDLRPWIVSSPDDLDDDDVDDFVIATRHQACVFAVSGRNGSILWVAARGGDLGQPIQNPSLRLDQQGVLSSALASPLSCGDVDGDGVSDWAILFVDKDGKDQVNRWLESLSGKNGQTIWRQTLDRQLFASPASLNVPESFRWFYGGGTAMSRIGGSFHWDYDEAPRRHPSRVERVGYFEQVPSSPQRLSWSRGQTEPPRLTLLAGSKVLAFDESTGQPIGVPHECGMMPGRSPMVADVDRDGAHELVLMQELPPASGAGRPGKTPMVRIGVWSLADQELLWTRDVEAAWPHVDWPHFPVAAAKWPIVVDLDHDGRCELLVPNGTSRDALREDPWGGLEVLDAVTGEPRWQRRIKTMDQQIDRFLPGPDINGDGVDDVFVATLWSSDFDLYVDALSGRDGTSLWAARQTLKKPDELVRYCVGNPLWWHAGRDGWPQLVVPASPEDVATEPLVCIFSAGTGSLTGTGSSLIDFSSTDADGDGIEDLFALECSNNNLLDLGGTLTCFRGHPRERWNRLGEHWTATVDLDGDAVGDLIQSRSDGSLAAASAISGQRLWESRLPQRHIHRFDVVAAVPRQDGFIGSEDLKIKLRLPILPEHSEPTDGVLGDFDGDGTVDLIAYVKGLGTDEAKSPLTALSGKSGRILWSSELKAKSIAGVHALDTRDLDGDGQAEVIWIGASDWGYPDDSSMSVHRKQLQLAVLSGVDGSVRWHRPLSQRYGITPQTNTSRPELDDGSVAIAYGDLNADGVLDLIVPSESISDALQTGHELRALNGASGELMWQSALPKLQSGHYPLRDVPPPVVVDLDGDNLPEVVTLTFEARDGSTTATAVVRGLEGRNGHERWRREIEVPSSGSSLSADGRDLRYRPRPMVLHTASEFPLLCLNLWDRPEHVVVLDSDGKDVADFRLETTRGYHRQSFRVWACDVDDDGNDEILLTNRDRLMAVRARQPEEVVWQREVTHLWTDEIEGILSDASGKGRAQIVVSHNDDPTSVYGLDARTGERVWSSPIPPPRRKGDAILIENNETSILSLGSADQPPRLFFQQKDLTRVAEATRRPIQGSSSDPERLLGSRVAAGNYEGRNDPRIQRRLPWVPPQKQSGRLFAALAWSALYGVALFYLPVLYVIETLRRRRWGFKWLALLPVVTAIGLVVLLMEAPDLPSRSTGLKFLIGAIAFPVLLFLTRIATWLYQKRWRLLVTWMTVIVAASIVLGLAAILVAQSNEYLALEPGERFVWDGWWWILLQGAHVTVYLWIGASLFVFLFRRARALLVRSNVIGEAS